MFAEKALILRDDQQPFALAETRRSDNNLCRRSAGGKRCMAKEEKQAQQKRNECRHWRI